jgi:hypothetical protein
MRLIGINGFKRSGKGTVADILAARGHAGVVYQVGFADKVKILAARSLGYLDLSPRECIALMDEAKERWVLDTRTANDVIQFNTITGREFLQHIGTEARKLFGADFWVDQVLPAASGHPVRDNREVSNSIALRERFPEVDCVAITDLRFPNEAERVLRLGGEVWRVNRPGTESDGHDSEQVLSGHFITKELDNSGTIADLEDVVDKAIEVGS